MAQTLGEAVVLLGADGSKFRSTIKREVDQVGKDIGPAASKAGDEYGHKFGSALGSTLKTVGKVAFAGLAAVASGVGIAGGFGLKIAADMEQAEIAFTTMLGSGQKAQEFLTGLKDFAAKTPFEFPELQTAASSLISVGIDASKVIPIMTNLGNATSGMGTGSEGIKRATVALQQMNAAGRITGEDLNQLRDAGIPVYDLLAAATGKTKEEVAGLAQAGKLGKEELDLMMKALESGAGLEKFAGLMDKQSESLTGMVATLKDTIGMGLSDMMTPFLPAIKSGLDTVSGLASTAMTNIRDTAKVLLTGSFEGGMFGGAIQEDSKYIDTLFKIRETFEKVRIGAELLVKGMPEGGIMSGFLSKDQIVTILEVRDTILGFFDNIKASAGNIAQIVGNLGPLFTLAFGGGLMIALEILGPLIESVTGYLADHEGVVYGLVAAYAIWRAGMMIAPIIAGISAAMVAYSAATATGAGVTGGMAAAMRSLNLAFLANPITWVVIAIAALVAAVIVAWNEFDWFKNAVTAAWDGIKNAALWAWEQVLQPVFNQIAEIAQWLWNSVLMPVFGFIEQAWSTLVTAMSYVWTNILWPIFTTLADIVTTLWNSVLSPIFGLIGAVWSALMSAMAAVWNGILAPIFQAFWSIVEVLWNNILSPIFQAIGAAWSALADGFGWVWNNVLKPVFGFFEDTVNKIHQVFLGVVDGIGKAWEGMKSLVMAPVNWVIDVVWNNGLRAAWNKINDLWTTPPEGDLPEAGKISLATGGILPGYTPGQDVHEFYSRTGGRLALSGGEAIMRPEFTRALGPDWIRRLNEAARRGPLAVLALLSQIPGDPPAPEASSNRIPQRAFADGGVWEIPDLLSPLVPDWLENRLEEWANSPFAKILGGLVGKIIDGLWGFAKKKIIEVGSISGLDNPEAIAANMAALGVGGEKYKAGLEWANGQKGKPYIWGGVGPTGYDCSGFMSAITNVILGRNPYSRVGSTANFPWPGFNPTAVHQGFVIGSTKNAGGGIGHMAGTLLGVNVESAGGVGTRIGSSALGAYSSMFNIRASLMDQGGMFEPGTFAVNLSNRPEAVLTGEQTRNFQRLAERGSTYGDIHVTISVDDLDKIRKVDDFLKMLDQSRARRRQTERSGYVTV